ncbi:MULTISPECIES: plasminogen-binding N-terminal domain-containing protein [unclassified Lebetimonas]|uniref:plasminogen-binding N-terminal domain-containing protein n=1 Tax=unclassified Lebetimonas TaxID=2648158 RepID=UPI00046389DA|nr:MULTISPECIES: plasminogen-binding N-terminal domain-containing protein [unclassified Lebetimonas]
MKRILILFVLISSLMGYEVTIKSIQNDKISVDKYVKKGVSGIVLCPYENKNIICAKATLFGTEGKLSVYDNLENDSFALPVAIPKPGDKIILAKNYNRIMIIAPNQQSYLKAKELFKNKTLISPDIFATFLEENPTRDDFINFAKKMDIGLYAFVLDKIYLVDSYSFYAIKEFSAEKNYKYTEPFFVTYPNFHIEGNVFSKVKNLFKQSIGSYAKYYKSLIKE